MRRCSMYISMVLRARNLPAQMTSLSAAVKLSVAGARVVVETSAITAPRHTNKTSSQGILKFFCHKKRTLVAGQSGAGRERKLVGC